MTFHMNYFLLYYIKYRVTKLHIVAKIIEGNSYTSNSYIYENTLASDNSIKSTDSEDKSDPIEKDIDEDKESAISLDINEISSSRVDFNNNTDYQQTPLSDPRIGCRHLYFYCNEHPKAQTRYVEQINLHLT